MNIESLSFAIPPLALALAAASLYLARRYRRERDLAREQATRLWNRWRATLTRQHPSHPREDHAQISTARTQCPRCDGEGSYVRLNEPARTCGVCDGRGWIGEADDVGESAEVAAAVAVAAIPAASVGDESDEQVGEPVILKFRRRNRERGL